MARYGGAGNAKIHRDRGTRYKEHLGWIVGQATYEDSPTKMADFSARQILDARALVIDGSSKEVVPVLPCFEEAGWRFKRTGERFMWTDIG